MPTAKPPEAKPTRQCHTFLPEEIVLKLDELAGRKLLSRSSYLRLILLEHLEAQGAAPALDARSNQQQHGAQKDE